VTDDSLQLDATALRVLAHPLRSRLLSELRLHGAATATELADRLATNTGATSYHLRKLESVGLVLDTATGAGKRRVWEAATRGHSWEPSDFAGDDRAEESMTWLTRHYVAQQTDRAEQWFQHQRGWPQAWRDALGYADDGVIVTPAQARELAEELQAVMGRYREAGAGDPAARRVLVSTLAIPVQPRFEGDPS
jgi:DNA-binding transcriptional ArsR family regulator